MRAINHTVTGTVVGATVSSPLVAMTVALLSHLVLDIIPHSGSDTDNQLSRRFRIELMVDVLMSSVFLLTIIFLQLPGWQIIVACGVIAAAPDLWWLPYWLLKLAGKPKPLDRIGRFLSWIQWYEKPWGYAVEAIWLVGSVYLFLIVTSR